MPDGPGGFRQDSSCPALLGIRMGFGLLRVRGFHPLRPAFPDRSTRFPLAVTPSRYPDRAGTRAVWALPRPLAATRGITFCFLFLRVLGCFGSPRWPGAAEPLRDACASGCPVRTPADRRLLAPPRRISPLAASFLASWSLGIHRPPLLSFPSQRSSALRRTRILVFVFSFPQHVNGLFPPRGAMVSDSHVRLSAAPYLRRRRSGE